MKILYHADDGHNDGFPFIAWKTGQPEGLPDWIVPPKPPGCSLVDDGRFSRIGCKISGEIPACCDLHAHGRNVGGVHQQIVHGLRLAVAKSFRKEEAFGETPARYHRRRADRRYSGYVHQLIPDRRI